MTASADHPPGDGASLDAGGRGARLRAPGLAVYNHLVLIDDGKSGPPTVQELMDRTRQGCDGAVVVGEESHGLLPLNFGSRAGVTPTPSPRRA